jgi:hypothetical protein
MHGLNKVIEEKELSVDLFFDAMHSFPNKVWHAEQTATISKVKDVLNGLSTDIENYNNDLLAFEREVKRLKTPT